MTRRFPLHMTSNIIWQHVTSWLDACVHLSGVTGKLILPKEMGCTDPCTDKCIKTTLFCRREIIWRKCTQQQIRLSVWYGPAHCVHSHNQSAPFWYWQIHAKSSFQRLEFWQSTDYLNSQRTDPLGYSTQRISPLWTQSTIINGINEDGQFVK